MTVVCLVFWLIAACFATQRWLHMLQLNSYRAKTQLRRFRESPDKLICLLPSVLALGVSLFHGLLAEIATAVLLAIACGTLFPPKAKKPLVYTSRIKRLIATHAVL